MILSIFATAATVVYLCEHQPSKDISGVDSPQPQQLSATEPAEENQWRAKYKPIPLDQLNSASGSDPANLALNALDETESIGVARMVEVNYPQPNQAMVTITQRIPKKNSLRAVKYRVEMTTFGRSLLVSSPRVWRIIWAGSLVQCSPESSPNESQKGKVKCES
ncbi:hypothetical protein [Iningainema tapete]